MLKRWPVWLVQFQLRTYSYSFLQVFYECAWCCTVGESGLLLRLLQFCALKMLLLCRRFTMLLIHIQGGDNYNTAADFKMEILCMHGDTNVDRFQYSHLLLTSLIQCLFLIMPKSKNCSTDLIF
jgi:hypothetical protein